MSRPRIALVVQRYGSEVLGGAEDAARMLAEHLTAVAEVHVITTCAIDYTTWANVYPAGVSQQNGVTLHRFAVDQQRDWGQNQKTSGQFWLQERTLTEQMNWIQENGPYAPRLVHFIKQSATEFDVFIFFTYVYATTFLGLPLVAQKAILIPTAHDEPMLTKDAYRILFHLPRHMVYLTEGERDIAQRMTGNEAVPHTVTAIGLSLPDDVLAERFRLKYGLEGDFLLFGGRLALAKNVPELIDFFLRFRQGYGRELKLVLMGSGDIPLPTHPDIIAIGFVSEQDKFDALAAATVVVQPSLFESLSLIILQAWLVGTPVLVHGRCEVTKQQCRRSNGGFYYHSFAEFTAVLNLLLADPDLRITLGQQGQRYTAATYNWETIIASYQTLFQQFMNN